MPLYKFRTSYDPPIGPTRSMDWNAISDNYEAGDPIGYGATEAEAIADLLDNMLAAEFDPAPSHEASDPDYQLEDERERMALMRERGER